ncbi:extracellular solute-binding protein [Adhaeribacter rhizoryzae]|uniref:Extracellular solute-binding protein n=1 Tax=Adhaeribacter rhizoryzae TaxID=2607907 RepID=A0A5M6DGW5_9BACT|nr:extracellular solute-binding protein [Adhaeribacter rhizoryzae]KAA5546797.1 extracellular solute-binding protein [Adhaeribacter rhizoryzae]
MPEENKIIRFAVRAFGPFETALAKIWAAYRQQTNCSYELEMVPLQLHDLHEAILVKEGLKNGDWDLAHINTDWITEAYKTGALLDLAPFLQKNPPEDYPQGWTNSLLGMQQFGSAVVGLPFHDGPECLIYRKDLFADPTEQAAYQQRYGTELKPPTTWEEFWQIARFFQRPEQNLYGAVFAAYPDGHNTVFDFCLQLWSRGGSLLDATGHVNINTPAARAGLEFYRQILRDIAAVHPRCADYDSVQAGMAFARGEVALMVNWFGFASYCEVAQDSQVKGQVQIAPVPQGPGGQAVSLNVYWLYAIGSGNKHQAVIYDFLKFALQPAYDKLLTLEGGIGCRLSTWHDPEVNALIPYYHKLENLHQHARELPRRSDWAQIAAILDEVVLQVMNSDTAIDQLLQEGQSQINQLSGKPLSVSKEINID